MRIWKKESRSWVSGYIFPMQQHILAEFLKVIISWHTESALLKNKPRLSCYLLQGPVPRFDWRRDRLFPFEFFDRSSTPWVPKTFRFQSGIYQKHPPKVDFLAHHLRPANGNFNSSKAGVVTSHKKPYMRGRCHSFRLMVQLKIKLCNNILNRIHGTETNGIFTYMLIP